MIVADTNLLVYLLIPGEFTEEVQTLYREDPVWVAPSSWRIEFLNVLTTYCRRKLLTLDRAAAAMQHAETLVRVVPVEPDAATVIQLSMSSQTSGYDCVFVVTAQMNSLPLVTFDGALLTKFPDVAIRPDAVAAWFARRNARRSDEE